LILLTQTTTKEQGKGPHGYYLPPSSAFFPAFLGWLWQFLTVGYAGQIQTGPTRVQFGVAANTHNRSPVQSRRTSSVIESRPPTTTAIRNPRASRAFKLLDDEHRSSLLAALRVAHKNAINHPGDLRLASLFGVQLENCYKVRFYLYNLRLIQFK